MNTRSSAVTERPREVHVIEYFAKSFKVIRNDSVEWGVCKSPLVLHNVYIVPFLRY